MAKGFELDAVRLAGQETERDILSLLRGNQRGRWIYLRDDLEASGSEPTPIGTLLYRGRAKDWQLLEAAADQLPYPAIELALGQIGVEQLVAQQNVHFEEPVPVPVRTVA